MEPISTVAIATILATKALEKTGENLGELLSNKTEFLVGKVSSKFPKLQNLFKSGNRELLQVGEAILEAQKIVNEDPEIAQDIKDLESAAENEANSKFQTEIEQIRQEIEKLAERQHIIQNNSKLANKIGVLNQASVETQTNNINI